MTVKFICEGCGHFNSVSDRTASEHRRYMNTVLTCPNCGCSMEADGGDKEKDVLDVVDFMEENQ